MVALTIGPLTVPAAAQERILFPAVDNAQAVILEKIRNEQVRLDVATWYLVDGEITQAIVVKHQSGVPVRVIGDRASIFEADPNTRASFEYLASYGVPIRLRYHPTWFPEIMHWKCGIFVGQKTVEFGSANWTTFELLPWSPSDFKDETAMFTDDWGLVREFLTRFDQMWADTTNFMDWPAAYKLETGNTWPTPMTISRTRLEPDYPPAPGMIWSQGSALNSAMAAEIDRENTQIDLVIYRLTDPVITDALVRKLQAGVPVRIMIEPGQYRQPTWPEYWLTGAHVDRLWVAGASVKQRVHQGLTHMKTLITSAIALNGSSNFTRNWQRDHNYFISALGKPALHTAVRNRFDAMFADTKNYTNFTPQPPEEPTLVGPASGATGVSTTPKLEWNRARWAVAFDVYLGTSPSALELKGTVNAQLTEDPPQTYSWTATQALQGNTTYYWRIVSRTFATAVNPALVAPSETRSFTVGGGGGGGTPTPFGGTPVALPGTIQAENFDNGGEGVAYHDLSATNEGGAYRPGEAVDIADAQDTGGGYTLGWVGAGEWLKYTVNVGAAGTYNLEIRVASAGSGGTFHIEANGLDKTGPIAVPNTGGWQTWMTITKAGVSLSAGQQVWRVVMDANGSTGAIGNINSIRVTATSGGGGPTPFNGTPAPLPGTIQAENFDNGGEAVAYHDLSPTNQGGAYRPGEAVDIADAQDTGGGFTLGWVGAGEWLKYTVNVTAAGTYTLSARVASAGAGGTFHIEVNGVDKTGPMIVPNTGGWQTWTTVTKSGVSLSAGQQVWRLVMDSNGATGAVGNFNYLQAASGTPAPTAPQIVIYAADVAAANIHGNWAKVADATAAGGVKLASTDLGAGTVSTAIAAPANYFDVTFTAQAGVRYRLWLRMSAAASNKFNDSLWVQFTGSANAAGTAQYRIGTTDGLNVNQATCASCTPSGWGWQNFAYWEDDTGEVWFSTSGTQTIRVQIREDGVALDQIVLSPQQYVDTPPGPTTNDSTIVPK